MTTGLEWCAHLRHLASRLRGLADALPTILGGTADGNKKLQRDLDEVEAAISRAADGLFAVMKRPSRCRPRTIVKRHAQHKLPAHY